jgi:hypothetical protein
MGRAVMVGWVPHLQVAFNHVAVRQLSSHALAVAVLQVLLPALAVDHKVGARVDSHAVLHPPPQLVNVVPAKARESGAHHRARRQPSGTHLHTRSGNVSVVAMSTGMPTSLMRRLGSGEMTVRPLKSTRLPVAIGVST